MRLVCGVLIASIGFGISGCAKGAGSDPGGDDAVDGAPPPDADRNAPPDAVPAPDAADVPPDASPALGPPDTCADGHDITTAALTAAGATVSGDTTGYANDLQPASTCTGYTPDGPDAVYFVNATAGQTIDASVTTTWDSSIFITQTCTFTPTCLIGADARVGTESVTWSVATSGIYYVIVESWDPAVFGAYSLHVKLQ
jgi:hypothetical protein